MKSILCLLMLCVVSPSFASADMPLDEEKALSKTYLEKMKQERDTQELERGVLLRPIYQSQSSVFPTAESTLKVVYEAVDREGNVFDSAFTRDAAADFPL